MGMYGWGYDLVASKPPHRRVDPVARSLRELRKIDHGEVFGEILQTLKVRVSFRDLVPLCAWLSRVSEGSPGTIVSVVCPDYATESDSHRGRIVYTFDGLGEGVGLVAARALEAYKTLWDFFRKRLSTVRFIIAMADQEAESKVNCNRVGLSRAEFIARMRKSQQALAELAPTDIQLETPFLTEIHPQEWTEAMENARLLLNDTAAVREKDIRRAVSERRRLYHRWAGRILNEEELRRAVLSQVPEYAAVGSYLQRVLPDVFVLGADDPATGPFVKLLTGPTLPLLYLERPRYH